MSGNIAKITLNPETRQVTDIVFFRKDFRFKCKRCAVFCCKLGGPRVSEKDVERLTQAGYSTSDFLDVTVADKTTHLRTGEGFLRQKEDGSCIFLQYNSEDKVYKCSVYDFRPALCRLYPFEYEKIEADTIILKFIPCCNGLNARGGALVDKEFIEEHLLEAILDLL